MSKRLVGPFPRLQGLPDIDIDTADMLDILERQDLINHVLADAGCNCNGHALGAQRDTYWGADLSELVARCSPHDVTSTATNGQTVTDAICIKIGTLLVEVDSNNEICAWIYDES